MVHESYAIAIDTESSQTAADTPQVPCCPHGCRYFAGDGEVVKNNSPGKSWAILNFVRNETIYRKGARAHFAYKVIEGAVRLSRVFGDGRRQIVNFYMPGDMFGFELLDEYSSSAEAAGECIVMRCPLSCVLHSSTSDANINRQRLELLSKSLSDAERHVAMLGHQSARQRVASFFLAFEQHRPVDVDSAFELELPLGRQDIADYLGLTIETTCRALSELKRRQIIEMPRRRQVVVRDPSHLRAIAEGLAA